MQKEYYQKSILAIFLTGMTLPIGIMLIFSSLGMIGNELFSSIKTLGIEGLFSFIILFLCGLFLILSHIKVILTHINYKITISFDILKIRNILRKEKEYKIKDILTINKKQKKIRYATIEYAIISFKDGYKIKIYNHNPNKKDFNELLDYLKTHRSNHKINKKKKKGKKKYGR